MDVRVSLFVFAACLIPFSARLCIAADGPKVHLKFAGLDGNRVLITDTARAGRRISVGDCRVGVGVVGKAIVLDGDPAQCLNLGDIKLKAPATVAYWVRQSPLFRSRLDANELPEYHEEWSLSKGRLFSQLTGATRQGGAMRLSPLKLEVWDGGRWQTLIDKNMPLGEWAHIAVVFGVDGTMRAFLDGIRQLSGRGGFDFEGVEAGIGARALGTYGACLTGSIDDFRIYGTALSDEQIRSLVPPKLLARALDVTEKPTPLARLARREYLSPVRPGVPGKLPFWNRAAHQFLYAPSFEFKPVDRAKCYRFTLTSASGDYVFEDPEPWATLTPVWNQVPAGIVKLKVEGLDGRHGNPISVAGERTFYRAAMYNGPYHERIRDYSQSAQIALRTLFNRSYFKEWMKEGVPAAAYRKGYSGRPATAYGDSESGDYDYPAKLIGAIIAGSALYANIMPRPKDADEVLEIGRKACDLLLALHIPAGTPMEFFPPTYQHTLPVPSHISADHIMTHYPAEAAVAYLDFFDVTKERRCFEAARKIADTYRKLQLANGTWYQMMDNDTGKPLFDNFLVPSTVILFLDRLNRQYGLTEYEGVKHRAMEWIMAHTMKTFNWQSQFEDGQPNQPYQSLAHAQACEWATYLLTHPDDYPNSLSMALELIRFVEDQFVIWEKQPLDITLKDQLEPLSSKYWVTPCVAEQHQYWMPVNFSASLMVQCYLKAYEVTGNKLYRAKAEDVANALLVVQEMHNGEYPTYLLRPTSTGEFEAVQNVWINCGVYTARSVLALGKALSNGAPGARRNAR